VVRQRFGQPAIHGERAAPIAVFFAVRDERGINVEAVEDRFEERVAEANAVYLDTYRCDSLDYFFSLTERINLQEAA
jgi:hypothetical protein